MLLFSNIDLICIVVSVNH